MKKQTFLSVAIVLSFIISIASCIEPNSLVPDEDIPFDYEIMFSDEIQIPAHNGGDRELTFTIMSPSQTKTEDVEIWLEGVPDRIDATIEPKKVRPTANVTLTFKDKNIRPGYYPAIMHTKSSSGIKKDYPFKFKVMEKRCTDNFSGGYDGPINCIEGSNGTGMLTFTEHQAEKDRLLFWWAGWTRYADVDCYDRTMTFVEQKLGDSTFSGHATYSEDYKTVTMTYIIKRANGSADSCTTSYTR